MKQWNELSMKEKHNIIRESVSKGIHSLDDIKAYYDNYYKDDIHQLQEGGERNYQTWKSLIAKYKGLDIDNDNTYDYEGYYNAYPNEAWDMLNDNPEAHFTDEFKTVYHPTFSNESSYNGKVNMQFNPYGKLGGTWTAGDVFIPAYNQPWPNRYKEGGPEENYTPSPNEADKIRWFEHWYNNREKQLADNYRNYPGVISSGDIVRKWLPNNLTDSYFARKHKNYLLQNINTVEEKMMDTGNSTALERLVKNGSYDPYEHSIRYSPYSSPSTYIHERTHASQPVAMEHLIYNTNINRKEEVKPDYYYDKPQEIYSRLNQFRYENNLDPAETITPEKLEYLKKNAKDYNLLNRYDDNTLLFLFNDVAYNPTEQHDTPNITAFGGPLIHAANRYVEGGPEEDKPVLFTPYLNDTPMQAAMRQLNADYSKPENRAAIYNATHPISPSNGGFVANSDGSFSKVNPDPAINTMAEPVTKVAEYLPVIGDAMYAGEVYDVAKQGNYGTAAALLGLAALPNALEKPIKKVLKKVGSFVNAATAAKYPSALEYAYRRNPELAKIGTIDDYENYIKTIFPESKVQDIQYHMGPKGIQELKPSIGGDSWSVNPDARGIYVTPERSYSEALRKYTTNRLEKPSILTYIRRNITPRGWKVPNEQYTEIYPVMVDTRNPLQTRGIWTWGIKEDKYNSLMNQYDGIINKGPRWWQNVNKMPETIIPTTEQTFILGTDRDVAGFSNYMKSLKITPEKAANITKEQWTAAQDAAIARGDMAEAQRLRDLHFKVNAPNTVVKNIDDMPARVYHGTYNKGWVSYDKRKFGTATDNGLFGEGLYATSDKKYADVYARGNNADETYKGEIKDLYVNAKKPFYVYNGKDLSPKEIVNREDAAYQFGRNLKVQGDIPNSIWDEMNNSDIVIETKGTKRPNFAEIVIPKGEQIKSANAVTYDDNGVRIPLGERDNFNINDIRYIWPIAIMGTTAATAYGANQQSNGGPKGKRFVDVLGNIVSAFGITPKYPDTMPTQWSEVLPEESYTELPTMTANQIEGKVAPLPNNNEDFIPDFTNIKTKDNFGYNIDNLTTAYHYFKDNMKLNDYQIASLLANGIAESGFDPKAHNPKTSAKGLYQWLDGRYKYSSDKMSNTELLNEQLQYINDTLNNTEDQMSWHHGGDGSGYNKAVEAHDRFYNAKNLYDAVHSFTYGYNRPDSVALRVKQRYDLAQKILERLQAKQHKDGGKIYIKPENRGKFTALKKRTGHSASWFKAHGTPAQKKMATFALNAKKWKHDDGGFTDIPNLLLPPTKENLIYSGHKSWYNK